MLYIIIIIIPLIIIMINLYAGGVRVQLQSQLNYLLHWLSGQRAAAAACLSSQVFKPLSKINHYRYHTNFTNTTLYASKLPPQCTCCNKRPSHAMPCHAMPVAYCHFCCLSTPEKMCFLLIRFAEANLLMGPKVD